MSKKNNADKKSAAISGFDWLLGETIRACALMLMALGVVFVSSAAARLDAEYNIRKLYAYTEFRQAIFFIPAIIIMQIFASLNYRRWSIRKNGLPGLLCNPMVWAMLISLILLVIVLIPGIGIEKNYARRWLEIPLGPVRMSFQPSELAKWCLVFLMAAVLAQWQPPVKSFLRRFLPLCGLAGITVALIVIEDFGTAAFVAVLAFMIMLFGGVVWWYLLTPLPPAACGFFFSIVTNPTRINRLKSFFTPDPNAVSAEAYQITQSLIAIATGGLWGKGLGNGISKYGHLPEDTTDFIFAVICEELGLAGACLVIFLFIMLLLCGIIVVLRCKDRFGQLLASGIVLTICLQAAINIAVVTQCLPTKGIALPYISAGGSGLLLTAAASGVLINIARSSYIRIS